MVACTPGRLATVAISIDDVLWVPSPGVAVYIGLLAQAKLARFEGVSASVLRTPYI